MKLLILLTILLIGLTLSSCTKPIVVPPTEIYCPTPAKPSLSQLDNTKPLCDINNIKILLNDFNMVVDYSLKLEQVIDCYVKSQPKKDKDKEQ